MRLWLLLISLFILLACSGPEEFPEVEFLSPFTAKVIYKGKEYILEKDSPPPPHFPFIYRFEEDGDLDLKIGGRWIEFDNPFDLDIDTPKFFKRSKKTKTFKYQKKSLRRARSSRKR